MLGSRAVISLIDLLACSLASMIILAVTFMASRDAGGLGAYPGRSFMLRVVSEDEDALLALVVRRPNAATTIEVRPVVGGLVGNECGPLDGERCILTGWTLGGAERVTPPDGGGRTFVAAFPQPTAGRWTLGVRFFNRAGGARTWPVGEIPSTTFSAFHVTGVDGNPCAGFVGARLAIGDVALCDEFVVELEGE